MARAHARKEQAKGEQREKSLEKVRRTVLYCVACGQLPSTHSPLQRVQPTARARVEQVSYPQKTALLERGNNWRTADRPHGIPPLC